MWFVNEKKEWSFKYLFCIKHSQGFEHKKSLKYSFVLIHAKFYDKCNTIDPSQKKVKICEKHAKLSEMGINCPKKH